MAEGKGRELVVHNNPQNEAACVAMCLCGGARADEVREKAYRLFSPEAFHTSEYAAMWKAMREAHRRKLPPDPVTLVKLSNGEIDLALLTELMAARPDVPADATVEDVLATLAWDHQKKLAVVGPIEGLMRAIQDNEDPAKCRSLARQVAGSFDGWGDRRYLHDPETLVREQMADVRSRQAGQASYPFGLPGLDYYETASAGEQPKKRIVAGTAPGLVTILTGWSSSGKSAVAARMALGMAREGRRVLYAAWEPTGGMVLELVACMLLNWSRTKLYERGALSEEELATFERAMQGIGRGREAWKGGWVRCLGNPFGRNIGDRESNEHNLDVVQGYVADSGCDVVIFDLWERCLVRDEAHQEKRALFRQQAMLVEMGVHGILLAQQKKEMEGQRPTMAGIKGSGGWYEIGDNVLGVYRPYLAKPVPDNTLEISILKQKQGVAPLAVEFDWDAERGMISGGRSIEYERPGFRADGTSNPIDQKMREPRQKGKR